MADDFTKLEAMLRNALMTNTDLSGLAGARPFDGCPG